MEVPFLMLLDQSILKSIGMIPQIIHIYIMCYQATPTPCANY
uniref:Uncharacterized protein n=1 Tax=Arundo donax TaxID=35708 RepID=A0A0A9F5W3_ARUDO